MIGNTFNMKLDHTVNPNIDILSGDIIYDSRHAEQSARDLTYNEETAIPMEMEASSFTLGVIETRGWNASSLATFRKDAAEGHLHRGWTDKSTASSRRKVFDRMSEPRK